jgi:hypothetical protein
MTPDVDKKLRNLYMGLAPHRSCLNERIKQIGMTDLYGGSSSAHAELFSAIEMYVGTMVEYQIYKICSSPDFFNLIIAGASDVEERKDGLPK